MHRCEREITDGASDGNCNEDLPESSGCRDSDSPVVSLEFLKESMLVTERVNRLVSTCLAGPFTKEIQQVRRETSRFFDDPSSALGPWYQKCQFRSCESKIQKRGKK